MALVNPSIQDRRPSNTLNTNLASNNPFRNRAISPSNTTALSPNNGISAQPATRTSAISKNPFLDESEFPLTQSPPISQDAVKLATDIFGQLTVEQRPTSKRGPRPSGPPPPRPNGPPPSRSERHGPPMRDHTSPLKSDSRRPRGLSESSVQNTFERERRDRRPERAAERTERTESEERRRRQRRKEREERHRREKEGEKSKEKPRSSRKPQGLDLIDKLDVTGIYGQGLFHHDGPFDACNPHRNKRAHRAPMQAFPEGSANMAVGGNGPLNQYLDLDRFHGRGTESFSDYSAARKNDMNIINPLDRTEQVHGNETSGLGTSTFLEGAPAPRSALQRRGSQEQNEAGFGGLTRKKSLAQRFRARGFSNARPGNGEPRSPDGRYNSTSDDSPPQTKAVSAGGLARARYTRENEIDPFDKDYRDAQKGAYSKTSDNEKSGGSVTWTSETNPARPSSLIRSVTADEMPTQGRPHSREDSITSGGGGFLNRMRSIRGGRRGRTESKG